MPAKSKVVIRRKPKIIHARIKNPVLVRKTLLEAGILSLENLKILKNIRRIKKRKDKLKMDIRRECNDMRSMVIKFQELLPQPEEIGINVQKESEKELRSESRFEERKRKSQERLMAKTTRKEENPFEQKDELDFDIEKLKEKIKGL